jgi:hypothetical protein
MTCNHRYCVTKGSFTFLNIPCTLNNVSMPAAHPNPWKQCFTISNIFPFTQGLIHYISSFFRLTSERYTYILWISSPGLRNHFCLLVNSIPLYGHNRLCWATHLLEDIFTTFEFWQLSIKTLQTFMGTFCVDVNFSAHLNKFHGAGFLNCIVRICLVFYETAKLFSKAALAVCISISN